MNAAITRFIQEKNILSHTNQNILICRVPRQEEGITLIKELLYRIIDRKTALYLSGGKTPIPLYEQLVADELLLAGNVGMVDERFGDKFHATSNETMMRNTNLLRYLQFRNVQFYPMLSGEKTREETAYDYDELFRSLLTVYQKHVAVLGIGDDGHIAGIAPNRPDFENPMFGHTHASDLVSEFDDYEGPFKERVSMTFLGLSMMDVLVVGVFGEKKKKALERMFNAGREEAIPARFYTRAGIAEKTVIITDQEILI